MKQLGMTETRNSEETESRPGSYTQGDGLSLEPTAQQAGKGHPLLLSGPVQEKRGLFIWCCHLLH